MKNYRIPIIFQTSKEFNIEAESLEEVCVKAMSAFLKIPDDDYIQDSAEFDDIIYDDYDENVDIDKVWQKLD